MAIVSNQIEQADITRWGITALAFGGVAMLSISLSGLVPESFSIGLHSTRLDGGNLNLLRQQVAYLLTQQDAMERGNDQLQNQIEIAGRSQGELVQRLGALETSIPMLFETLPSRDSVDRTLATGSIGNGDAQLVETDGGSVRVSHSPMFEDSPADDASLMDALPALPEALDNTTPVDLQAITPDLDVMLTATEYGLALGEIVDEVGADAAWDSLQGRVGTLLIGLEPALSDPVGSGETRIVVGPITDYAAAETLCLRIARVGVPCLPVQYAEDSLTQFNEPSATN